MEYSNNKTVLVTGGSGFVALHCIHQLLVKGYTVKTTLRSLSKKDEVINTLRKNHTPGLDRLFFIEADLTKDHNWPLAQVVNIYCTLPHLFFSKRPEMKMK